MLQHLCDTICSRNFCFAGLGKLGETLGIVDLGSAKSQWNVKFFFLFCYLTQSLKLYRLNILITLNLSKMVCVGWSNRRLRIILSIFFCNRKAFLGLFFLWCSLLGDIYYIILCVGISG